MVSAFLFSMEVVTKLTFGFLGRIIPRFEQLSNDKLGFAKTIREVSFGTQHDRMLLIEGCPNSHAVTVLARS